jgi:hypothetical protein
MFLAILTVTACGGAVVFILTTNCVTGGQSLPATPPATAMASLAGVEVIWPLSQLSANGDQTILMIRMQKYGASMPLTGITIRMLPEETQVPFTDISISNDIGELVSDVVQPKTGNRVQIDLKKYAPEPSVEYLYVRAQIPPATPPGEYPADLTVNSDTQSETEYSWKWVITE